MTAFLDLPQEITERALINAGIKDVASVAQVCQFLRRIIYGNESHVWRGVFLKIFDDPRKTREHLTSATAQKGDPYENDAAPDSNCVRYDWRGELRRRIIARRVLLSPQYGRNGKRVPRRERIKALNTIIDMILAAITVPPTESLRSYDLEWVEDLLSQMDEKHYDGYGLYNPSPPSDLDTGHSPKGDGADHLSHPPELLNLRMTMPLESRHHSTSSQNRDSFTGDNSDQGDDSDDDSEQYSVARERVLRARLRLVRGYSDRQKALVPVGLVDPQAMHSMRLATDLRLYARARVYDLGRYTPSNKWAPFISDTAVEGGIRVDWEQVEAFLICAGMNIFDHVDHDHQNCPRIINPFGLESSRAYTAPGCEAHSYDFAPGGDWAGVTGKWNRLISFCDYRDLRSYNVSFPILTSYQMSSKPHFYLFLNMLPVIAQDLLAMSWPPRQPHSLLADPQFSEAVHVLSVQLRLTDIGDASTCHPAFPNRPRLGIVGDTTYNGTDMSKLSGYVSMTPEGAIGWDLVSSFLRLLFITASYNEEHFLVFFCMASSVCFHGRSAALVICRYTDRRSRFSKWCCRGLDWCRSRTARSRW